MKLLLLTLSLVLFMPLPAKAEQAALPRLHVEGNRLQTPAGTPVTLRGVSLCSLDWHEPLKLLDALTDKVNGWNINIVRLPVQPSEWERIGAAKYLTERLDPAVEQCRKEGLYCIIDWHEIADWDKEETARKLERFWSMAAPRYAHEPFIMYEIFNEPIGPSERNRKNWLAYREKAQKWVNMIREDAPNTILLVGSPHWSQMPAFAVDDPLEGTNLVYVSHIYGGWPAETWDGLFGEAAEKLPLFMTEWGWSSQRKNRKEPFYGTLASYGKPMRDYLEARPQISWTAWSYDPACGPAMVGKDREMGDFVRQWLEEKKSPPPQEEGSPLEMVR